MAPTMEQLGRRVAEWRARLLDKELKVNAGKVMAGSSGEKMIVNLGKWTCGVCGKGVQANSVQCAYYVKTDSQAVQWCGQCDGTIQEADLAEDLMVDGEMYECVKKLCYLGNTLGDCGADLAATARIRNEWMNFWELLPFLTSRAHPRWRWKVECMPVVSEAAWLMEVRLGHC